MTARDAYNHILITLFQFDTDEVAAIKSKYKTGHRFLTANNSVIESLLNNAEITDGDAELWKSLIIYTKVHKNINTVALSLMDVHKFESHDLSAAADELR